MKLIQIPALCRHDIIRIRAAGFETADIGALCPHIAFHLALFCCCLISIVLFAVPGFCLLLFPVQLIQLFIRVGPDGYAWDKGMIAVPAVCPTQTVYAAKPAYAHQLLLCVHPAAPPMGISGTGMPGHLEGLRIQVLRHLFIDLGAHLINAGQHGPPCGCGSSAVIPGSIFYPL